jgi:hypothetical protein
MAEQVNGTLADRSLARLANQCYDSGVVHRIGAEASP